jgi:hypothetical protein
MARIVENNPRDLRSDLRSRGSEMDRVSIHSFHSEEARCCLLSRGPFCLRLLSVIVSTLGSREY